jgi:hypothetical protein
MPGRHSDNSNTQIVLVYTATWEKFLELSRQYNLFIIAETILMF